MVKFRKSLSKTLIITVALGTFLLTTVQAQSVQAVTSKASKGKIGVVIKQPILSKKQKAPTPKPGKGKGDIVVKTPTISEDQKAATAVDTLIVALPKLNKITLANETAVNGANAAYTALTDIQKSLVKSSNKATLTASVSKIADFKKAAEVNVLINALPKIDKLTVADTTSVNEAYAAFTALSKSQKALLTPSNSGKITAAINKIASFKGASLKALSELNSGKKAFSNFVKAGVTGAVEENNTLYFAEIAKAKAAKGSALTLVEVQAIVDTVNKNVSAPIALVAINAGTEIFADFATAGITGAVEGNKAAYDTEIAKAKATKGSALILAEVQAIVDTVNKNVSAPIALVAINAGTEIFADFATAGITGAVEGNKAAYDSEIAAAKETKGSDLTLEEVQTVVNTKNQAVVDFKAAQVVINQIAALDNTKETYAADVAAAKEAYAMLTDAQKALVTNYETLVSAV